MKVQPAVRDSNVKTINRLCSQGFGDRHSDLIELKRVDLANRERTEVAMIERVTSTEEVSCSASLAWDFVTTGGVAFLATELIRRKLNVTDWFRKWRHRSGRSMR